MKSKIIPGGSPEIIDSINYRLARQDTTSKERSEMALKAALALAKSNKTQEIISYLEMAYKENPPQNVVNSEFLRQLEEIFRLNSRISPFVFFLKIGNASKKVSERAYQQSLYHVDQFLTHLLKDRSLIAKRRLEALERRLDAVSELAQKVPLEVSSRRSVFENLMAAYEELILFRMNGRREDEVASQRLNQLRAFVAHFIPGSPIAVDMSKRSRNSMFTHFFSKLSPSIYRDDIDRAVYNQLIAKYDVLVQQDDLPTDRKERILNHHLEVLKLDEKNLSSLPAFSNQRELLSENLETQKLILSRGLSTASAAQGDPSSENSGATFKPYSSTSSRRFESNPSSARVKKDPLKQSDWMTSPAGIDELQELIDSADQDPSKESQTAASLYRLRKALIANALGRVAEAQNDIAKAELFESQKDTQGLSSKEEAKVHHISLLNKLISKFHPEEKKALDKLCEIAHSSSRSSSSSRDLRSPPEPSLDFSGSQSSRKEGPRSSPVTNLVPLASNLTSSSKEGSQASTDKKRKSIAELETEIRAAERTARELDLQYHKAEAKRHDFLLTSEKEEEKLMQTFENEYQAKKLALEKIRERSLHQFRDEVRRKNADDLEVRRVTFIAHHSQELEKRKRLQIEKIRRENEQLEAQLLASTNEEISRLRKELESEKAIALSSDAAGSDAGAKVKALQNILKGIGQTCGLGQTQALAEVARIVGATICPLAEEVSSVDSAKRRKVVQSESVVK